MTARYFPASMSSLSQRTSLFVYRVIPSASLLPPNRRARTGTCHMNPRSVSRKIPPDFSERLHRRRDPRAGKLWSVTGPATCAAPSSGDGPRTRSTTVHTSTRLHNCRRWLEMRGALLGGHPGVGGGSDQRCRPGSRPPRRRTGRLGRAQSGRSLRVQRKRELEHHLQLPFLWSRVRFRLHRRH
jgi:hypothetical protein